MPKDCCPHCGANITPFPQRLSTGLVGALIKAVTFVQAKGMNQFHLQKDLVSLSKNEYNNFQKLRFHGLVAKAKVENKPGYWLITRRGGQFLRGELFVPKTAYTLRNKVIGHSNDLIGIKDFMGKFPAFQTDFSYDGGVDNLFM